MADGDADYPGDLDIFRSTIADDSDDTEGSQKETPTEAEPKLSAEDEKRYQYWQSQADKERRRAEMLLAANPLAEVVASDPELLVKLQEEIVRKKQTKEAGPQRPQPPARPADYDEGQAYTEPGSASHKYRVAMDNYREQLLNYYDQRDAERDRMIQGQLKKQQEEEAFRAEVAKLRLSLAQKGMNPVEVEEFLSFTNDPRNFTVDNLVNLYRGAKVVKPKDKGEPPAPKAISPPFVAADGGEDNTPDKTSENDKFMNDLLAKGQRRRPPKQ